MFGGWKTTFTIGYGLPLEDFLFSVDGKRALNFTFGSPMKDLVIDNLLMKVNDDFILRVYHFNFWVEKRSCSVESIIVQFHIRSTVF